MILYLSDWCNYTGAKLHLATTNKSFIQLSALYKSMGIRNHGFLLALHNPELEYIDPHSTDLSIDQMAQIAVESKINPWYFFREVARIPVKGSPDAIPFKAHRGNIALYWLFFNHIMTILIQIRQTGKSVAMDVLDIYLLNIAATRTTIALLTKDDGLRSFNLERLKEIQSELPFYLNMKTNDDISNTEMMTIKALKNEFRALVPQKSPKAALTVGRGLTVPILRFDEASFLPNIAISAPSALAAGTAARDYARSIKTHYGTIFATTAGKKDDKDGRFVYDLMINSAVWSEKFYDLNDLPDLEKTIRLNSPKKQLRVNCTFNHRQLGYSDEWLKEAIESTTGSGENIERDFFNKWTSGSQMSPLPSDITDKIRKSQKEVLYTEISSQGYLTRWYVDEDYLNSQFKYRPAVIGIDSSDAAGGDDIAIAIRDVATGAVIGAGNYNETNLIAFSEWLLHTLLKYSNTTIIIERRSTGAMIIDYLCLMLLANNINPFKRLYNRIINDYTDNPNLNEVYAEITKAPFFKLNELVTKYKKSFGFATSGTGLYSRSELYSTTLLASAKYTSNSVHDYALIDQILGLVNKNGRIDHEDGSHDDLCIAWLLGYWLISKGKNLSFYGIKNVLTENYILNKEVVYETSYDNQKQIGIKKEIDNIIETMKKEKDDIVISRYENRLKYLYNNYDNTLGNIINYDNLILELRELRSRKMKENRSFNRPSTTASRFYL